MIGFIFQTFNLLPVLTAYENVEYPLLQFGDIDADRRDRRIRAALDIVGLTPQTHHRPDQLSGGQRQRVAIARALATQPKIVLADEPTANLDHNTGEGILQLMKDINHRFKTTFIFSTHDRRVMAMADRLVGIEDGQLTMPEVTAESRVEEGQFAMPGVGTAPIPAMTIREKITKFLYIENRDASRAAPWYINTEAEVWVVSVCTVEVREVTEYIRNQLDAQDPFHKEIHDLIGEARLLGIEVNGWPSDQ
jgi:ABC-type sugar transport system ATPase subunit